MQSSDGKDRTKLPPINWREKCHTQFKEQLAANRRRRHATEQAFELDIHVPLGLVERKQQPHRRNEDFSPERGMEAYQLTQEVIAKTYQHNEFLDEVIGGINTKVKSIAIIKEPGAGKTTISEKIGE